VQEELQFESSKLSLQLFPQQQYNWSEAICPEEVRLQAKLGNLLPSKFVLFLFKLLITLGIILYFILLTIEKILLFYLFLLKKQEKAR
jgi:hypothetical protein